MKFFLILILLLSGCHFQPSTKSAEEVEIFLADEWLYVQKLEKHFVDGQIISRPPGINQLLAELTLPENGGLGFKTHCLYYRVPYKNRVGKILIQSEKDQTPCPEVPRENAIIELSDIRDLKISSFQYQLKMEFLQQKKAMSWTFLFPNIKAASPYEKYEPQKESALYPGMTFLKTGQENLSDKNNRYLGRLSDRLSKGTAIRCLQIDKSCRQIGEDRCEQCRFGWYQVVDYDCQGKGSRFCGQNHCGEKNEPACIRGFTVAQDTDSGICQNDLTPVWNAEHILVCQ